ncbi:hypothetical protein L1987_27936 [Smallanthus sonchifolius]|uniref:Uncharacterized protein n=1 Tax=Smallanthus sonchifolius TaxID=185202 RepID=A0ACB9ID89_9ASTR|nr:hypothetical protein L1987_27936 [Smallanthus sonchifolius]
MDVTSRISDRISDGSSGVRRRSRLSRDALATPADYFEAARHGFQQIVHEGGWISKAGHRHGSGSGGGNGMPDGGNGVVLRSRGSGGQICGSRYCGRRRTMYLELDSDTGTKSNSKIEPTKAEEEAIARGLQDPALQQELK